MKYTMHIHTPHIIEPKISYLFRLEQAKVPPCGGCVTERGNIYEISAELCEHDYAVFCVDKDCDLIKVHFQNNCCLSQQSLLAGYAFWKFSLFCVAFFQDFLSVL